MAAIQQTYEAIISDAKAQADWYLRNKNENKTMSRSIRFFSILFFGLGGLFPLIGAATDEGDLMHGIADWGYISLALAGILIMLDKFFGFSSGWIRYITTEMEIRKKIKEFEMVWNIDTLGLDLSNLETEIAKVLLKGMKDFALLIDELVKQETNSWAMEFQSNISELQKAIDSKLETVSPGSIKTVVSNTKDYKNLKIKLDNLGSSDIIGNVFLFKGVSSGHHLITVTGTKGENNEKIELAEVVVVESNKLSAVEITME